MKVLQVGNNDASSPIREAVKRIFEFEHNEDDILHLAQFVSIPNRDYKSTVMENILRRLTMESENNNNYFFCGKSSNRDNIFTDNSKYKKLRLSVNIFGRGSHEQINEIIEDIIVSKYYN